MIDVSFSFRKSSEEERAELLRVSGRTLEEAAEKDAGAVEFLSGIQFARVAAICAVRRRCGETELLDALFFDRVLGGISWTGRLMSDLILHETRGAEIGRPRSFVWEAQAGGAHAEDFAKVASHFAGREDESESGGKFFAASFTVESGEDEFRNAIFRVTKSVRRIEKSEKIGRAEKRTEGEPLVLPKTETHLPANILDIVRADFGTLGTFEYALVQPNSEVKISENDGGIAVLLDEPQDDDEKSAAGMVEETLSTAKSELTEDEVGEIRSFIKNSLKDENSRFSKLLETARERAKTESEEDAESRLYARTFAEAGAAVRALLDSHPLKEGSLFVVGCSSSEIVGGKIGKNSSETAGRAVFDAARKVCGERGIFLACQCCEHLNRALVVESECAEKFGFERVSVVPWAHGGGSLATAAYRGFSNPVVVETIRADAGIDIGGTMIGMHLKAVAVPVHLEKAVGRASVSAAFSRPRLIGGERARYSL